MSVKVLLIILTELMSNNVSHFDEIPADAKTAWAQQALAQKTGVWEVVPQTEDRQIVMRLDMHWLLELQRHSADGKSPKWKRFVFGPDVLFAAEKDDGSVWTVPAIEPIEDGKEILKSGSNLVARYMDRKHFLDLPFCFLPHQETFGDFFQECPTVSVSTDKDICKIEYRNEVEFGWFRFDMSKNWRMIDGNRSIMKNGKSYGYSIEYQNGLDDYVVSKFDGNDFSDDRAVFNTRITRLAETPNEKEFSLAFYGIQNHRAADSSRVLLYVIGGLGLCLIVLAVILNSRRQISSR